MTEKSIIESGYVAILEVAVRIVWFGVEEVICWLQVCTEQPGDLRHDRRAAAMHSNHATQRPRALHEPSEPGATRAETGHRTRRRNPFGLQAIW